MSAATTRKRDGGEDPAARGQRPHGGDPPPKTTCDDDSEDSTDDDEDDVGDDRIAVVGMNVRLPHASTPQEFWTLLDMGVDCYSGTLSQERQRDIAHVVKHFPGSSLYTGYFFSSVDTFDPTVFGISHREALFIEPEQRMFLEMVHSLFESSGVAQKVRGSNTAVFVGHSVSRILS